MSKFSLDQYDVNGFAVVENFLSNDETDEVREAGLDLFENAPEKNQVAYKNHSISSLEQYIFDSVDKINYFYDNDAIDSNGNLIVDKTISLNRLGHGLHLKHPVFKKYTLDERVRNIAKKIGFRRPAIMQSVFVYKNTKCKQHQDVSHLIADPVKVTTFWITTEDANIDNGCLWFVKGSHKHEYFKRVINEMNGNDSSESSGDENEMNFLELNLPRDQFTAVPVKAGSLVILDGSTIHFSDSNFTDGERYTYTFRIMETDNAKFEPKNWFRSPELGQVARLY